MSSPDAWSRRLVWVAAAGMAVMGLPLAISARSALPIALLYYLVLIGATALLLHNNRAKRPQPVTRSTPRGQFDQPRYFACAAVAIGALGFAGPIVALAVGGQPETALLVSGGLITYSSVAIKKWRELRSPPALAAISSS